MNVICGASFRLLMFTNTKFVSNSSGEKPPFTWVSVLPPPSNNLMVNKKAVSVS